MSLMTHLVTGSTATPAPLETFRFPAGEFSVKVTGDMPAKAHLLIDVRGTASDDLVQTVIIGRWAKRAGHHLTLALPYLPAARSDHDDVMGVFSYADIVRAVGADEIMTLDPHSPTAALAYDAVAPLHVIDHTPLVVRAARRFAADDLSGIVAADKSGSLHAAAAAKTLGVPMFQALKIREPSTGALSHFECEPLPATGKILVVDDICDGGGTFAGLAQVAGVERERLGLWVTHGVFSGRVLEILPEHFDYIASTDSVRPVPANVDGFDIHDLLIREARA